MLMVSFAERFHASAADTLQFKNLTKPHEKGIMMNFYECIERIFTKRMRDELMCEFTVNNENKLVTRGEVSSANFLSLFSVAEFNSPELIWNTQTRGELLGVLQ